MQARSELSRDDVEETALTRQQVACIDHWNELLAKLPDDVDLPSFPIWGDEILASYRFRDKTPYACTAKELRRYVRQFRPPRGARKGKLIALLPSYARRDERKFPKWKIDFIEQNRLHVGNLFARYRK